MAEALLSLRALRKRYGALVVTDDVSLDVQAGTIHAVIGPNGAGKTSLIHQIGGTVASDSGTVRLAGRDVTRLPPHRRARAGLGRLFQIVSIFPDFTLAENVALAAHSRRGQDRAEHVAAWLDRVGLAARAGTPAGRLSHGEKRQLELAIALAARPRVLLLDEPLAGAGPEESARLIGLLGGLRTECTILLVEHDMAAVFALADEISVLAQGRVIATGAPAAIRADPAVRAAYLGEES